MLRTLSSNRNFPQVDCDPCYELDTIQIYCTENAEGKVGWEKDIPSCGIKKCEEPDNPRMVNVTEDFGLGHGEVLAQIVEEIGGMKTAVSVSNSIV